MANFSRIVFSSLLAVSVGSVAMAGEPVHPLPRPVFSGGVSIPVGGYYGGASFGGATTAHESILRGQADVIRARGEHALLTSEAARSFEEAKSRFLDNEVKRLAVRQERKRLGIAERAHRHEYLQARRETQMALNRAAREIQQATVPAAVQRESQAQNKLRLALNLLNNGKIDSGVAYLQQITEQFGQTDAAQRAATILNEIRG